MDIRGEFPQIFRQLFLFCIHIKASLIFIPIVSSFILPSQNRNQHERSFLFHLLRNPAYNHQSLQSDRLLQYSLGCLALRSDKGKFPVIGNPLTPVPVVYAVSFLRPVIYFPYAVLLSHRLLFRKYLDRFSGKNRIPPYPLAFI